MSIFKENTIKSGEIKTEQQAIQHYIERLRPVELKQGKQSYKTVQVASGFVVMLWNGSEMIDKVLVCFNEIIYREGKKIYKPN